MRTEISDLVAKAMKLPSEARAALAASLLDSLDESLDSDAESAWRIEVARRLSELDSGGVRTVPWSLARRKIARR